MSIRVVGVATVLSLMGSMVWAASSTGAANTLGASWSDATKMPDLFSGMWMTFSGMVEADERLNIPYTATAQKFVDAYEPKRDIPYAQEGCMSPGLPISMRTGPVKFTFSPNLISIYMQSVGHTRFIRLNQAMGVTSPKYYGNSVGHWEGDTLVVETEDFLPEITFQYGIGKGLPPSDTIGTGNLPPLAALAGAGAPPGPFPPGGSGGPGGPGPGGPNLAGPGGLEALTKAIWGPHGEHMRMVERIRLANPDTLEMNLTVYDDTVWTKPFVTETRNYKRIVKGVSEIGPFSGEPEEWVCTVSITSFDPATNTYMDKDPEEMVKYLDNIRR